MTQPANAPTPRLAAAAHIAILEQHTEQHTSRSDPQHTSPQHTSPRQPTQHQHTERPAAAEQVALAQEQPLPPSVAQEIDAVSNEFANCINAIVKTFMEAKEHPSAAAHMRSGGGDGSASGASLAAEPDIATKAQLMFGSARMATAEQLERYKSLGVVASAGPAVPAGGHSRLPAQVSFLFEVLS